MKTPISFRLSPDCISLLKTMAEQSGVSHASIVEMAVREKAKREKVTVTALNVTEKRKPKYGHDKQSNRETD